MVALPATGLALVAAVGIALQALTIERGVGIVRRTSGGSSALAASITSVVVSIAIFVVILAVRGIDAAVLPPLALVTFAVAGMLDPFVLRLAYFEGIDRAGARVSATALAMNPVLAALIAVPVLGETLTVGLGVGIGCIVVGGGLLQSSGDSEGEDLLLRELAETDAREVAFPLLAMAALGISVVLVKIGLEAVPEPVLGITIAQTAALGAFLVVLAVSGAARESVRRPNGRAYGLFFLAGVFVAVGLLSQYMALEVGSVVTVIPIVNTFPLIVVALSYLAVRQVPRSPRAIGGIVAIVVGAILVQLV